MYGVLIVDDEKNIRDSLVRDVPWEEYGFCVLAEAEEGEGALALARSSRPSLVITDIRMPEMDGICLIRELKRLDPAPRVIVLSGYSDFTYVKESLLCGAENYLLKPLRMEELYSFLAETYDKLERERKEPTATVNGLALFRSSVLNRLVNGQLTSREVEEKTRLFDVDLSSGPIMPAGIVPFCGRRDDQRYLRLELIGNCERELAGNGGVFLDDDDNVALLLADPCVNEDPETAAAFMRRITGKYSPGSAVGIGRRAESYRTLPAAYTEMKFCLRLHDLCGDAEAYDFHAVAAEIGDAAEDFISLLHADHRRSEASISSGLHRLPPVLEGMRDRGAARRYMAAAVALMFHAGTGEYRQLVDDLKSALAASDEGAVIAAGERRIRENESRVRSPVVGKMREYLETRFSDPSACLKSAAAEFGYSRAHLGRVFKEETGMFFIDCLNAIRIAQSKELLRKTTMSGKAIGESVGIPNTNYFYRLFKKATGASPTEYRRSTMRNM